MGGPRSRKKLMIVGLYRTSKTGSRKAGELRLTGDGKIELVVDDERHRSFLERLLRDGVTSYSQRRQVTVKEPEAFLDAVLEAIQTSYWRANDEAKGPLRNPQPRRLTAAV